MHYYCRALFLSLVVRFVCGRAIFVQRSSCRRRFRLAADVLLLHCVVHWCDHVFFWRSGQAGDSIFVGGRQVLYLPSVANFFFFVVHFCMSI